MEFQSTLWTLLSEARRGDELALQQFVERYRPPLVSYLRRKGFRREAEDLAQEVFLQFFGDDLLERVHKDKGRFRSLVLGVTRNVVRNHLRKIKTIKRGGQHARVNIEQMEQLAAPGSERDQEFDQEWASHVLRLSLDRLKDEYNHYYVVIDALLFKKQNRDALASQMGKTKASVSNYLQRGKAKLADFFREEVRSYSLSNTECIEDLAAFAEYFSGEMLAG